jgi:ADP-ribose pyrophosphatase YjhB (NUDIX family)
MSWNKKSSKVVYENKWMSVTEDQVKTAHGLDLTYGVVSKPPFALIVPWDGERFTLVRQYRYPVLKELWEFPKGSFEHASTLETAKLELKEETGLVAGSIEKIASYCVAPGFLSQECYVFLATDLVQGECNLEESELGMISQSFTLSELKQMIRSGVLEDSNTIAALSVFEILQRED